MKCFWRGSVLIFTGTIKDELLYNYKDKETDLKSKYPVTEPYKIN